MVADAIIFVFQGIAPWSNPLADFGESYVKTRVLAHGVQTDK